MSAAISDPPGPQTIRRYVGSDATRLAAKIWPCYDTVFADFADCDTCGRTSSSVTRGEMAIDWLSQLRMTKSSGSAGATSASVGSTGRTLSGMRFNQTWPERG